MDEVINTEEYEVPFLQPSKLNMEDYGKLIEEYDYKLENGKVKEIAYSQFDEEGNEVKCVGVSDDDGHYHRSVVIWPNLDENGYPEGYLNSTVLEMKLDLDSIDPAFDLSKVELFDYYNATEKTDDTFLIPVPDFDGEGVLMEMEADKNVRIAYYKDLNLYKTYSAGENVSDEDVKIFSTGGGYIISKVKSEQTYSLIGVIKDDNGTSFKLIKQFNGKERIIEDNPIDIISETCYQTVDCGKYKLNYTYDPDGTVSRVDYALKDGTTGIISRVETDLKSIGDCKEYEDETFIRRKAISLYPALITLNDELLVKYIGSMRAENLWAYDVADYDEEGNMIEFSRSIYLIDIDKQDEFIDYFTHNDRWPILL